MGIYVSGKDERGKGKTGNDTNRSVYLRIFTDGSSSEFSVKNYDGDYKVLSYSDNNNSIISDY